MKTPPGYEEAERAEDREGMDRVLRGASVEQVRVQGGRIRTRFEGRPVDETLRLLALSQHPRAAAIAALVDRAQLGPQWSWSSSLDLGRFRQLTRLRLEGPTSLAPLLRLPRLERLELVDCGPCPWPVELRVSGLTLEGEVEVDVSQTGARSLTLRRRRAAVEGLDGARGLLRLAAPSSPSLRDLRVDALPLRELDLIASPQALRGVERLPPTLECLAIRGSAASLLQDLPALRKLRILKGEISVPRLDGLEKALFERVSFLAPLDAPALHTLELHHCDGLDFEDWLLPSLRVLRIHSCDLTTLAGMPTSHLEELDVSTCHSLKDIGVLRSASRLKTATFSQCSDLTDVTAVSRALPRGGLHLHQTAVDTTPGDGALDVALGRTPKAPAPPPLEGPTSAATRKHLAALGRLLRSKDSVTASSAVDLVRGLSGEVSAAFLHGVRWNEELRRLLPGSLLAKARAAHRGVITLRLVCELPEAEALRAEVEALDLTHTEAAVESLTALRRLSRLQVEGGGFTGVGTLPLRELTLIEVDEVSLWRLPRLERLTLSKVHAPIGLRDRVDLVEARECSGIEELLAQAQPTVFRGDADVALPPTIERLEWGPRRIVDLGSFAHMKRLRTLDLRRAGSVRGVPALQRHSLEELVLPAPEAPSERDMLHMLPSTLRMLHLRRWPLFERDFRRLLHLEGLEELVLEGMGGSWVDLPPELRPITTMLPRS